MNRHPETSDPIAELVLGIASCRTLKSALERTVTGIAAHPEVAQCRIWLVRPGDACRTCAMRDPCPDQIACLHLVANEGDLNADETKGQLGAFPRFPIGVGLLGRIARSSRGDSVEDIRRDPTWGRAATWARETGIRGFAVEPMRFGGVNLGVVGAFTRRVASRDSFGWIRNVVAHAASAVDLTTSLERVELENKAMWRQIAKADRGSHTSTPVSSADPEAQVLSEPKMRSRERENLLKALNLTRWKIYGTDGAAALLGLRPTTLTSRIKKMNIRRESS